jgi:hypothetical protein
MLEDESGLELRGSEAIDRRITALRESDDDRDIYSIVSSLPFLSSLLSIIDRC